MSSLRKLELPLVLLVLTAGAAFLLKMCYLSLALNCVFGLVFLSAFYAYVRSRHGIHIPPILLGLVFGALQVDALGNFFRMYGQRFGPIQYDEFSHMAVQVLITPINHLAGPAMPGTIRKRFHGRGDSVRCSFDV